MYTLAWEGVDVEDTRLALAKMCIKCGRHLEEDGRVVERSRIFQHNVGNIFIKLVESSLGTP